MTDKDIQEAIENCLWRRDIRGAWVCDVDIVPCEKHIYDGKCPTLIEWCREMSIDISKPILDDKTLTVVVHKLTGECYPYGNHSIDADRKSNLKVKIAVAESLLSEIIEAGKLYDRPEYSIQDISNTANQWLVDMRDWLNALDYLAERWYRE